jgi:hypothetical protein
MAVEVWAYSFWSTNQSFILPSWTNFEIRHTATVQMKFCLQMIPRNENTVHAFYAILVEHKSQEVVTLYLMVKKSHEAVIK